MRVGSHVRGGDVLVRAEQDGDFRGVPARQVFEFLRRQPGRVANHAAFRPAERNIDHGAFNGHPEGQGAYLVNIRLRVVADAALRRAARDIMVNPIAGEHFHRTIAHIDGEVDREFALGGAQHLMDVVVQADFIRDNR